MSTLDGINNNSSGNQDNGAPAIQNKNWNGKNVCRLDILTMVFGSVLIVTGITVCILSAQYMQAWAVAGYASMGVGGGVFLLGTILSCCTSGARFAKKLASQEDTKEIKATKKNPEPLSLKIGTEKFFESKGIFGLPKKLLEEIDNWRSYRTNPTNCPLAFEAGLLLYGPPGTGKTTIAKYICELLGGEYFEKRCGDLKSTYHGETENNITQLFSKEKDVFKVIVIDEISGLLPERRTFLSSHLNDEATEHFLGVVNGERRQNPHYILIGTTNDLNALDPAVVRSGRLGAAFEIKNPRLESRKKIFEHHLARINVADSDRVALAHALAIKTRDRSCADITGMIGNAEAKAFRHNRAPTKDDFEESKSQSNADDSD